MICPAMRKQTPTGARKMIHVVIRIITTDTDVKKSKSGRPSSPHAAMAIPVTMLESNSSCSVLGIAEQPKMVYRVIHEI